MNDSVFDDQEPPPPPTPVDIWRKMFGRTHYMEYLRSEVRRCARRCSKPRPSSPLPCAPRR